MKDLLTFDTLITPKVIVVVYYLGLLGVTLSGLGMIFGGMASGAFFSSLLGGILIIVFGALAVRLYCELFIVFFKMNEALQELRKK